MSQTSQDLFKKVLNRGAILILAVAIVGGIAGVLIAGIPGLISALIGAAMALVFVSLTAVSVWLGGKLSLGGFFGVVLGLWILKLVGFIVLVMLLKGATFVVGPILFVNIVASVIGSLILDAVVVLKSRIPTVEG